MILALVFALMASAELVFHFEENLVGRRQPQLVESPDLFLQEALLFLVGQFGGAIDGVRSF